MTIRPGEPWGETVARPPGIRTVATDAALAELAARGHEGAIGLTGGDLHAALGAPGARDPVQRLPIDVIRVLADGTAFTAIAHVVVRRSWWRGPIVAAMNVDRLGAWRVAPRAHPNDGQLDVVEVDAAMSIRQRWAARRRLPSGDHVPHPNISVRRAVSATWTFERPHRLDVDGVTVGRVSAVEVHVEPDALVVHA